ncbi:hypothetical protein QPK14_11255 [Photorhabdus temperata subsp. temperata]|uniref:Uncharacterized protein n=2 Tax=Photorhabdus temperata TaxID=574560 RepID=A0A081RSU2_PHOTE|nr:hypothetical protein [Photorhabdus temperata]ERT14148.1 hypothetical protein O185_05080 [Photorhabdus temperata J3]KER01745.1 hypothetical protein MEG1DRAFT_03619 [Photorhabdus temperata subsp. temperata Meg1]
MVKQIILLLLALILSKQAIASGACPVDTDIFSLNKGHELCFKGTVLLDDIDGPHKILSTIISKDGKVAGKLISYPAKNEDPDDDCCAYSYALYLKQIKSDSKIESKIVVSGKGNTAVEIGYDKKLCPTLGISFSPDASKTYIECMMVTGGNEIRFVDNKTGKISDVIVRGNGLDIVGSGKYEGYIVTSEHEYYEDMRGSYDRYYLVSPDGKKSIPLSEDWGKVKEFLEKNE